MSTINTNFSIQTFSNLDEATKRAIYQEANEKHNVELVRQLNDLGMKPTNIPPFRGPAIASNFMDIATKYDIIFNFLKNLRETNRFLTNQEFQSLSDRKWRKKNSFSRILGCDHLMQKISEKNLKHIKLPLKVAVVNGEKETFQLGGCESIYGHYNINSYNDEKYSNDNNEVDVYAEEIEKVDRKLSREEIEELVQVIADAYFTDLWDHNFILGKDGVYFIDTEFKSFEGCLDWDKMRERIGSLVKNEDKEYFLQKIAEKEIEVDQKPEMPSWGYMAIRQVLNGYEKYHPEKKEQDAEEIKILQEKKAELEYVGSRKTGCNYKSNIFTFNVKDILKIGS